MTSHPVPGRRQFLRRGMLGPLGALAASAWPHPACPAAAEPGSAWRLRFSFSTVMLPGLTIEEVCEQAARLGFEAIDLWGPFGTCRHLADAMERLGAAGLKQVLARHQLQLSAFSTYVTSAEKTGFPAYAGFISQCGGGIVVRQSDYGAAAPGSDLTSRMRDFFEKLKPQLDLAARSQARLAIENHGHALLNNLDSFKAFVELNPAPDRVGLALAPYHLQATGALVEEAIRIAGPQLLFFYAWQRGSAFDQLPGHGPADFAPWIQALAHIRYPGYVNPFLHGESSLEALGAALGKSLPYLQTCRNKASGPSSQS